MSGINISYLDFPNVCRICLSHGDSDDLQKFNLELVHLYKSLTNFEVKMDDRFPKNICRICKKYLDDISFFIEKCKKNEVLLKKIYLEEFLSEFIKQNEETLYRIPVKAKAVPQTEQNDYESQLQIKVEEIDCEDYEVPIKVEADDNLPIQLVYNLPVPPSNDFVEVKTDIQTQKELKRFVCDLCGKGFLRKASFKNHMYIHTGERPHKCVFCGKGFKTSLCRTVHVYRVHNKGVEVIPRHKWKYAKRVRLRVECEICGKILTSRFGYGYHQLTHKEIKDFLCYICGKKFITNASLQIHHTTHTKETPFECKDCGKLFKLKTSLHIHISRHKRNKTKTILNCPHCDKKYSAEISLNSHLLEQHTDKPLECPYCGERFNEKNVFRNHLVQHVINIVHKCDVCNKLFLSSTQLKDHSRVHTGEKPYTCSVCGNQFAQIRTLKVHMRQHTGEKPYVCSICGRGFHDLSNLRWHLNMHHDKHKTDENNKGVDI